MTPGRGRDACDGIYKRIRFRCLCNILDGLVGIAQIRSAVSSQI
jgi:hypothetical protein